jgi:hypothetical protein
MTSDEFIASETMRVDLRTLLSSPVFRKASEVVLYESIPHVDNLGRVKDGAGNAMLQQIAGMKQFLKMLHGLADGRKPAPKLTARRLMTEADRDILKQQEQE